MIYRFEEYTLDSERRELRRGDGVLPVQAQVFDLLEFLINQRQRVVSKDDLFRAVWHGRFVSDSTLTSRVALARQAVNDTGQHQRLIRTVPYRGYRFVGAVRECDEHSVRSLYESVSQACAPSLERFAKPSIAVLPLADWADNAGLADAITEAITVALSQFRWLNVSASRQKSAAIADFGSLGRELRVRYVLRGSLRKFEKNTIRLSLQLIDTVAETYVWASRFDEEDAHRIDVQDRITANVVAAIALKLEYSEIQRALTNEGVDAYTCTLRGMKNLYQWTKGGIDEALTLFHKAIELDPEFAPPYGIAAYCYVQRQSYGWVIERERDMAEAGHLARQAAELAQDDAVTLSRAAHALAAVAGDVEGGAALIERAMLLNPHAAGVWYVSGWMNLFLGNHAAALEALSRAAQLSSHDRLSIKIDAGLAYANFFLGRYEEASSVAQSAISATRSKRISGTYWVSCLGAGRPMSAAYLAIRHT